MKAIKVGKTYIVNRGLFKGDVVKVCSVENNGDIMCRNISRGAITDKPIPWKASELKEKEMSAEKRIEDIYPLTIIQMKYGGKFVIFNASADTDFVGSIQEDKEVYWLLDEYLDKYVEPYLYGIGTTISEAFNDYKIRQKWR